LTLLEVVVSYRVQQLCTRIDNSVIPFLTPTDYFQTGAGTRVYVSSVGDICGRTIERSSLFSRCTSVSCFSSSFTICVNRMIPRQTVQQWH